MHLFSRGGLLSSDAL